MQKRFEPGDIVTVRHGSGLDADYGYWIVVEHRHESDTYGRTAWVKCLSPCGTAVDWSPRYVSHVVSCDIG